MKLLLTAKSLFWTESRRYKLVNVFLHYLGTSDLNFLFNVSLHQKSRNCLSILDNWTSKGNKRTKEKVTLVYKSHYFSFLLPNNVQVILKVNTGAFFFIFYFCQVSTYWFKTATYRTPCVNFFCSFICNLDGCFIKLFSLARAKRYLDGGQSHC